MTFDVLLVVVATAVAQSLFGVGVLLFGTPLLLLLGHDFIRVLGVLLPVSLVINLLQVARHHAVMDGTLYRRILCFTLPPIAIFLFLVTHVRLDIGLVVGPFLLLIAAKEFVPALDRSLAAMMRHERLYCIVMGVVHGLSNLGGSLLTALVHHKEYGRDVTRVTVAASYATFATIQLLTLILSSRQRLIFSLTENGLPLLAGLLVFLVVEAAFFDRIAPERYRRIFAGFLATCGLALLR